MYFLVTNENICEEVTYERNKRVIERVIPTPRGFIAGWVQNNCSIIGRGMWGRANLKAKSLGREFSY
jgi:hypothetical protein